MTGRQYSNPYSASDSSIQYSLPSITSQQTLNNIVPPSHPTAVSVTSTPPPPMMNGSLLYPQSTNLNNPQNYNGSYNFNKRTNGTHQVRFTPKYKKKGHQSPKREQSPQREPYEFSDDNDNDSNKDRDQHPLVLPSHSVSNKVEDEEPEPSNMRRNRGGIGLQNITEEDEHKHAHEKNKSTLAELVGSKQLDALQMNDSHGGIMNMNKDGIFTPPPRAPMKQFEYINPTVMNEEDYENDIVKPHAGYNVNSKVQPLESKTDFVNASDEMADAGSTAQNTMVSLLAGDDGYGAAINDELNLSSPPMRPRENSNNHLAPLKNNNTLPHLRDGDEDISADEHEVNLHYSNNNSNEDMDAANTIANLYGDITKTPKLQSFGM